MSLFRKPKPLTPQQKLADIRSTAQHWANVTQRETKAVDIQGVVRYQRGDFPLGVPGVHRILAVAQPEARQLKVAA